MAEGNVPITPGSGANIDVIDWGVGATNRYRQIFTLGDGVTQGNLLAIDALGRLTIIGSQPAATTGTITTATSVVGPLTITSMNVVTVSVHGTYAGVTFVFEGSDDGGTTWYSLQASRTDISLIETGSMGSLTNTARSWDVPVGGMGQFRVRATTWTSGTATISLSPQAMPFDPAPTVGLNHMPSYAASTNGTIAIPVTASTTTSTAYLWHPATVTKRYEIYRIELSVEGPTSASTGGQVTTMRLAKITAENAIPGGTAQTINVVDGDSPASGGTFRTLANAPATRVAGDLATWNIQTVAANVHHPFVWDSSTMNQGRPLVCRASIAEGWELRAVTNGTAIGTGGLTVAAHYFWKEL